jgi:hypothetical protein
LFDSSLPLPPPRHRGGSRGSSSAPTGFFGLSNGVWYKVKQGMRGLLVHDCQDTPVVFLLDEVI